jgi:iron complex outermembrane receptor protein
MKTHRLFFLGAAMLSSVLSAQTPPAKFVVPNDASQPMVLAPFEVTGSRVKRTDRETPAPVAIYTAAAIEERGYEDLGDFVQSLPFHSGTANHEMGMGSFAPGTTAFNPRGLGSNRSLTLVNGRRAIAHGIADASSGTPQSLFDFNSIPAAAIERIEFLKDGASALYGSEAIGGVMNIILKQNFNGSAVDVSLSNTLGHDSLRRRVSVTTGLAAGGWKIFAGAQAQKRNASFVTDYGLKSGDFRYLGGKGANLLSLVSHPAYVNLTAAQAMASGLGTAAGFYVINGGQPVANPTKASFRYVGTNSAGIPDINRYDAIHVTPVAPETENHGGHASLERAFGGRVTSFAQFSYQRRDLRSVFPPFNFAPANLPGLSLAANNPYNQLGIPLTNGTGALGFGFLSAVRANEVSSRTSTALAGLRGVVAQTWTWETAVTYGRGESRQDTDLVSAADLQAAFGGTTRATAYNPFGPSDNPNRLRELSTLVRVRDGETDTFGYSAAVSGRAFQLPIRGAGEVGLAAGYEFRRESLGFSSDPGPYLAYGTGSAFSGRRQTHAAYMEISAPLQKWLEVQMAGRHENYSDFGHTTKPKLSAKLRLPANRAAQVLLRGSWSESFKAPDLAQLHQTRTLGVANLRDPLRPQDGLRQVTTILGGNPRLGPENGRVQYAGAIIELPAIKGLSFTADYFDIQVRNVIFNRSIAYLVTAEGMQRYPDAIVRDNRTASPGPIVSVSGVSENIGFQRFRGWDLGLRYVFRSVRLGRFSLNADAMNTLEVGRDGGPERGGYVESTGRYGSPEWRGNAGLSWSRGVVNASVNADVTGKFFNNAYAAGWGENTYTVVNPAITWRGWAKTAITLSATNVFDHRPPLNGYHIRGFDDRIYGIGASGRIVSLRLRREF